MLPTIMRVHVTSGAGIIDGRQIAVADSVRSAGHSIRGASIVDVYIVDGVPGFSEEAAGRFFSDQVAQQVVLSDGPFYGQPWSLLIEVAYRPGVADPVASTIRDALSTELGTLPERAVVQTSRQLLLDLHPEPPGAGLAEFRDIALLFHNPLVQQATVISRPEWDAGVRPPERYPIIAGHSIPPVQRIDVAQLSDEDLEVLSRDRLLALDLREMRAIRDYYRDPEVRAGREAATLGPSATDVELEMIAQTWSEHCKHKIFAGRITYTEEGREPEVIDSLFKTYIRDTTSRVAPGRSFVKSVFDDNAGVVAFDEETLL